MKKISILLTAVSALILASCSKTEIVSLDPENETGKSEVLFDFNIGGESSFEAGSKAVKTGWAAGDVVFIFANDVTTEGYLRLTNTDGSTKGWNVSAQGDFADKLAVGDITIDVIHVPFADADVIPEYSDGTWTINTGDVFFTTETGVTATVSEENENKKIVASVELAKYPGYVQVYIQKDARFPEGVQYHCNQLDRFDKVTLTDGAFAPVAAADNMHFDVRVFDENGEDGAKGIVFYGILKDEQNTNTVFKVDGGFDEDGYPLNSPIVFTYTLENKQLEAKAYRLKWADTKLEWGKWARALWHPYKVSDTQVIRFSPANLQVSNQLTPHWRFADMDAGNSAGQATVLRDSNKDIYPGFSQKNKYYDLYQWGTSGVSSSKSKPAYTDNNFYPNGGYGVGGLEPLPNVQYIALPPGAHGKYDKTGYRADLLNLKDAANGGYLFNYTTGATNYDSYRGKSVPADGDDWGSNSIEYGNANTFYTMTADEWKYLLAQNYYVGAATVNGNHGWAISMEGTTLKSENYSLAEWYEEEMTKGAVFFPEAGGSVGCGWEQTDKPKDQMTTTINYGAEGTKYWTQSSVAWSNGSYPGVQCLSAAVGLTNTSEIAVSASYPWNGRPVRLAIKVSDAAAE